MGCCLTKNNSSPKTKMPAIEPTKCSIPPRSAAPLSPLFEEETVVKEVLSETPSLKPQHLSLKSQQEKKNNNNAKPLETQTPTSVRPPISIPKPEPETNTSISVSVSATEEVSVSEISEICSFSESVSTTTPITETKQHQQQQIQRKHNNVDRPPASLRRKRSAPTDLNRGSKSPARRPPRSPGRKNDTAVVKPDMGQIPRRSNAPRRDSGEGPGRRSRSPATRAAAGTARANLGRSPSRRAGRGPAGAAENGRKSVDKRPANESLENPLVSLECFIFL